MRKTLLFIKVFLLLTAFAGVSNIHAAESGSKNFFAASVCDLNAGLGNQVSSDDNDPIGSAYRFLFITSASFFLVDYTFVYVNAVSDGPFARAPPSV